MTKEEMDEILHILGIDADEPANQIYVFYVLPDGRVDNFSLTMKRGRTMSDAEVEGLMRREYPSTRQGRVVAVERPEWRPREQQWLDSYEVRNMLHVSERTVRNWCRKGYLHPRQVENHLFFSRAEVNELIDSHALQENGRLDSTALTPPPPTAADEEKGRT